MTWRELWKSTVSNLRAILGFSPPPPPSPPPPSALSRASTRPPAPSPKSPPPAPIVKHKPVTLMGPLKTSDQPEPSRPETQTIDLTPTRSIPPPSAPLRRKPNISPVDVALDAAAFAALHSHHPQQRSEVPPIVTETIQELSWRRNPPAAVDGPLMELPAHDSGAFEPEAGSTGSNGHHQNGYGDHHYGDNPGGNPGDGGNARDDGGADSGDDAVDEDSVALTTLLESLLFVAPEPVDPRQLAQTLAQPLEIIELGLTELADYYQRSLRGLRIQRFNGKVQLVTSPAAAPFIETFLNLDNTTRLSTPALETLAVIAYRQPVTRAQIEAVRGVDCAGVLRSLTQRGLVTEVGRMEGMGRPILYGVTELFMQHFGLMGMNELPPLEETEADRLWAATVIDEQGLDG